MLKLITLDLDNTLWHVTPTLIEAEKILFRWIKSNVPESLAYYTPENLANSRKLFAEQNPDKKHFPTFVRKHMLETCFLQAGLNSEKAKKTMEEAFSVFIDARNAVELFPETLGILQHLSSQYDVIALSNGNADLTKIGIERFFTAHYSAESVGKAKPDSTMFKKALHTANCDASETLHIGDHPLEDIDAAAQLGINTLWFNRNNKLESSKCSPTIEINSLDKLLDAVDCIHKKTIKTLY